MFRVWLTILASVHAWPLLCSEVCFGGARWPQTKGWFLPAVTRPLPVYTAHLHTWHFCAQPCALGVHAQFRRADSPERVSKRRLGLPDVPVPNCIRGLSFVPAHTLHLLVLSPWQPKMSSNRRHCVRCIYNSILHGVEVEAPAQRYWCRLRRYWIDVCRVGGGSGAHTLRKSQSCLAESKSSRRESQNVADPGCRASARNWLRYKSYTYIDRELQVKGVCSRGAQGNGVSGCEASPLLSKKYF